MDFIGGNLDEYLHPELHQDTMQGGAATAEPPPPEVPPQVGHHPSSLPRGIQAQITGGTQQVSG